MTNFYIITFHFVKSNLTISTKNYNTLASHILDQRPFRMVSNCPF
jgi:hypothetical protein